MNLGHFLTIPIASILALSSIVATQAMSGHESKVLMWLGYTGGWFLLFGVAAALPKMFDKAARRTAIKAFLTFGAGGVAGLILFSILASNPGLRRSQAAFLGLLLGLPWLLGVAFWQLHRRLWPSSESRAK